jgi:hypothetical protein
LTATEPHKTIIEDLMALGDGEGTPRASIVVVSVPRFTNDQVERANDELLAAGILHRWMSQQKEEVVALRTAGVAGSSRRG